MKSFLPLLSIAFLVTSCATAYKSGQTPDDVYFSPARPAAEYVSTENRDDRQYRYDESSDDQYLRMKVRNRRWSALDDGYYSYNPTYFSYFNNGFYYTSPWNPYSYWNYYYNPYYSGVVVVHPKPPVYSSPRRFNLNVYTPNNNNSSSKGVRVFNSYSNGSTNNSTNNYQNSGTNAGNFLRNTFNNSGSNSSSNNNSNSGSRAATPASSSSSGSSGSSSGHAPVRRF